MISIHKIIRTGQTGFTLLEVLIAVVIFTIGILSVNAMQITAIGANTAANRITESTTWASDRVESLLGLDYDDPALRDGTADGDAGLDDIGANADGDLTSPA
jgi:prepilin-type N-terminal cleavage/methylation domain-containing protein